LIDAFEYDATLGGVDLGDAPALAVEDLGGAVVDAGDDEIAGGEAGLSRERRRPLLGGRL
jgi:hypothetical protein